MTDFTQKSYERHTSLYDQKCSSETTSSWKTDTSVDAWRHTRMYSTINPILETDVDANWLTVGDGRFGRDAQYIAQHSGQVLATDISETLLKKAFESDQIQKYQVENAEKLSFDDDTFDYVFCKESYHHFPRPMIGLYEMLRVSKKAVILIEPNDQITTDRALPSIANWLKRQMRHYCGKPEARNQFETAGNYLYTISKREIEKAALGLGLPLVAFKSINDDYIDGCELENLSEKGPKYNAISRKIARRDFWCRYNLLEPLLLTAIIFKSVPDQALLLKLKAAGYQLLWLPANPYIDG